MKTKYSAEMQCFIRENVKGLTNKELTRLVNERFGTSFTWEQLKDYKHKHHLSGDSRRQCAIYPPDVQSYIRNNHEGMSPKRMTEQVNKKFGTNYSVDQIRKNYEKFGYKSGCRTPIFEGEVKRYILENYEGIGPKRMAAMVNDRFGTSITAEQMRHVYDNHGLVSHAPHGGQDILPVGHEKRCSDGSVLVKVSGVGDNAVYVRKHRLVWEQVHGPIPDDSYLIFLDGDKTNCSPENLRRVTKQEFFTMIHQDLLTESPAANESAILIARIRTTTKNRAKAMAKSQHERRREHGE